MSEYNVNLKWQADSDDFSYPKYTRTHEWKFGGGIKVTASAAPQYLGKSEYVNPEEAFVASPASCHLLTFFAIASSKKYVVKSYENHAIALVEKNANRKMAVTEVYLRPKVTFAGDHIPNEALLKEIHNKAHIECFIFNSVLTKVIIEPVF